MKTNILMLVVSVVMFFYGLINGSEFMALVGIVSCVCVSSEMIITMKIDQLKDSIERLRNENDRI